MILALRPLIRLVRLLWLLALALAGLAVAMYCFDALINLGSARPDRLMHLTRVEHVVDGLLRQLAAKGPIAALTLLVAVSAVAIGLALLLGSLLPARERTAQMERGQLGTIAARRSLLRLLARVLAERVRGVTAVKRPRLQLKRRGRGGRLQLEVSRSRSRDPAEIELAVAKAIEPVTGPFALREQIRVSLSEDGSRVE